MQLDERAIVDFGANLYGNPGAPLTGERTVYGTAPGGATALQYSDPGTFVGPDPAVGLDADDEVVFMASDAGRRAPRGFRRPRRAKRRGATRVVITDPVNKARAWVYLFRSRRAVGPAKRDYVDYDFELLSGDYKPTYNRPDGPNPESSTVTTAFYKLGFSDRWYFDQLRIKAGGASGADILDGYKFGFAPGQCGRSEATFNDGEGAFIVNKDGPVRAIRAYVGANSGPFTERTHLFYARRHDAITDLRVHPIPSLFTIDDMSTAALGMTYLDQRHQGGVPVDGVQDPIDGGAPSSWRLWRGAQGSLFSADRVESSFKDAYDAAAVGFYLDDSTPPFTQCWGDPQMLATAGVRIAPPGGIPNTAPGGADFLSADHVGIYAGPGVSASVAARWSRRLDSPLRVGTGRLAP